MEPLPVMLVLSLMFLSFAAGWTLCEHFHTLAARRHKGLMPPTPARPTFPKLRTVEVRGVHYVERKINGVWCRLAPTHVDQWAPPAWLSLYPAQEFTSEDEARTAMIAEAGRELADVPVVKAEL